MNIINFDAFVRSTLDLTSKGLELVGNEILEGTDHGDNVTLLYVPAI